MADRTGEYDEGNFGMWKITCRSCPLMPHTQALGQKAPECAGGMATNMQGPVILKRCPHLGNTGEKGFRVEGETLVVDCMHGAGST
jgi:hypothetical protein